MDNQLAKHCTLQVLHASHEEQKIEFKSYGYFLAIIGSPSNMTYITRIGNHILTRWVTCGKGLRAHAWHAVWPGHMWQGYTHFHFESVGIVTAECDQQVIVVLKTHKDGIREEIASFTLYTTTCTSTSGEV